MQPAARDQDSDRALFLAPSDAPGPPDIDVAAVGSLVELTRRADDDPGIHQPQRS